MGTWGTGNFDSDTALDIADEQIAAWERRVNDLLGLDKPKPKPKPKRQKFGQEFGVDDGAVMAYVDLILVLVENGAGGPPDVAVVEQWRDVTLAHWDAQSSHLGSDPRWAATRRCEIAATFEELLRHANDYANIRTSRVKHQKRCKSAVASGTQANGPARATQRRKR